MEFNKIVLGFTILTLVACGGGDKKEEKVKGKNEVIIHDLSDPATLNPINESDASASYIVGNIFQSLLAYDKDNYSPYGLLADSLPIVNTNIKDSLLQFTFKLRKKARWDDQSPITAEDVAFSLKLFKVPNIDCASLRSYFEMFDDITIDSSDKKKFTVHCNRLYHMAEDAIGGLIVLNPKIFDPNGVIGKYTIQQLSNSKKLDAKSIKSLEEYAKFFNESFNTKIPSGAGSGPYEFEKWETMQRITLKKKQNWWAAKERDAEVHFTANPDKIIYETVNDFNNALVMLKGGKMDVMYGIPNRDFVEDLQASKEMTDRLHLFTPPQFAYEYIGINIKNKKFQDLRVRKALSHLLDVDKIVEVVCYGLGERVSGFVHPSKKEQYNDKIIMPDYNVQKAKQLFSEAGWKDSNGDGVVDKMINGEKVEMEVNIMFNNGNERRKKTCVYFLEGAKAAGVKVIIQPREWSKMLEEKNKHDFELYVGGWISSPFESDPYQVWHSSSYNGGSNDVGFGNAVSDALIEKIRTTINKDERNQYYKDLQFLISQEVPVIFLFAQKERIAVNKRWTNVKASGLRPGFDPTMFKQLQ